MPGGDYLTTSQVAALTGLSAPSVAAWARAHHIRPTTAGRRVLYPAALVRWHHANDQRVAAAIAAQHRLVRFATNPLNRAA